MDVLKLLQDCIENFNLDVNNLKDIAFAICTADKMNGTNKRELDIDKFVESDTELSWDSILTALGVEPQTKGYTKLPRVQKLRVISDVLSLSLSDKVDGLVLSCDASKKVSKLLGVSLPSEDYADEDVCYENLKKIEDVLISSNVDLGSLSGVYKRLCIYTNRIKEVGGFDMPQEIESILIPEEIYNNLGKKCTMSELNKFLEDKKLSIDNYSNYVIDTYCFNLVSIVVKLFYKIFEENDVKFNLILMRADNYVGQYLPIGMYSSNNYTYRLTAFHNIPCYLNRKVSIVFSESTPFSEKTILACIALLYFIRKWTIKQEYIVSEMEGLINECRD